MDSLGMEKHTQRRKKWPLAQSQHAAVMVAADMYEATYSKLFQATGSDSCCKGGRKGSSFAQVVFWLFCALL